MKDALYWIAVAYFCGAAWQAGRKNARRALKCLREWREVRELRRIRMAGETLVEVHPGLLRYRMAPGEQCSIGDALYLHDDGTVTARVPGREQSEIKT